MALSIQSLSQPYQSTQQYLVTGTVGDTVTTSFSDTSVATIVPVSATLTAAGITFTAKRLSISGGATGLTFTDTTSGEVESVTVNMTGDPVVSPAPIVGQIGQTITVTVSELNDPNAFTLSIADTTIANITSSTNAEGNAVLSISLLKNGTTTLSVDDGHGGQLSEPILVGSSSPVRNVTIQSGECVIGGTVLPIPQAVVALQDSTTGYNGPGGYTISYTVNGNFVVTWGIPPAESTTQINIAAAVVRPDGTMYLSDGRTLQVTVQAVNSTIMAEPGTDGSYLAAGVVTTRTLGQDVLNMFGTVTSGPTEPTNPHQGQLFYNTTTNVFEVFENGVWVPISAIGASATLSGLLDVKIISPEDTQVLAFVASDGKWENVSPTLAADADVAITSPSDGQVLTYSQTDGRWENKNASTLTTTIYMPLVNGDLPGPGIMANEHGQCIYVSL